MTRFAPAIERLVSRPDAERALGPFLLVYPLGKGGFAPVWLAKEVYGVAELRTVAVKLFADADVRATSGEDRGTLPESTGAQRQRIVEEARALCQVEHPNVVRFYALHTDATSGVIGLVMEHVSGTSLDERVRALRAGGETMALTEALDVGVAVASALGAVHQVGLVHRDIKPANVVESAGIYKLIDFGIAAVDVRARPKTPARPTPIVVDDLPLVVGSGARAEEAETGSPDDGAASLPGTVGYMDPASLEGLAAATPASDLYALGATLFECFTGFVPAAASARRAGASGLSADVIEGRAPAPLLASERPDLPASLCQLVDNLLDPSPERRPRSAEAVAWELERIRRETQGRSRPLPAEEVGPFRGLGRFEGADRDVYFGRSVEIAASIETLRARGLLALIGPSGSGKSSLARAGVLPAIADGDLGKWPKAWDTVILTPGADAKTSVLEALAAFVDVAVARTPEELVAILAERAQSSGRGLAILVDQLEELVTISSASGRDFAAAFLARVAAQPIPGLRAVVAARRDLLDPLLALGELGRALTRATLLVSPMSETTWGDVIDQALAAYGYRLEDGAMRDQLLGQLAEAATAMPLVQFALTRLWAIRDRERRLLSHAALEEIGGIAGALEMHAEAAIARCATVHAGASEATRSLILAMTTPQGTRRSRSRDALRAAHASAAGVLAELEKDRLVTQEHDGVTLAHEVLLTKWKRAERWIAEVRESRVLAEALERDAREWVSRREADLLWKGRRLASARDLLGSGDAELGETARAFVRASRGAARRGRAVAVAVAATTFVALAAAAIYAGAQAKKASSALGESEAARKVADDERARAGRALADSLEAQGRQALFGGDNLRALLFLSGAYEQGKSDATLRFLLAEAERTDTLVARLEGHRGSVDFAAWSPGGGRLVTASADGTAKVWDSSTGKMVRSFEHGSAVFEARWSPDGDRLLTLGRDGLAKIWDSLSGKLLGSVAGESASFSPYGGRVLATASGVARIWNGPAEAPVELRDVSAIEWSPEGRRVAVIFAEKATGEIRDVERGAKLCELRDAGAATTISFSSGERVTTTDASGASRTYDTSNGHLLEATKKEAPAPDPFSTQPTRVPASAPEVLDPVRFGHRDKVTSRVAGEGGLYATTSRDASANLWRANRAPRAQSPEMVGGGRFARFSPCGRYVAAEDAIVDARYATRLGADGTSRADGLEPIFSADGERVLLAAHAHATMVESASGKVLSEMASPGVVQATALSRDGTRVATGEDDNMVRVWDAGSGALEKAIGPVGVSIHTVIFAADGTSVFVFGRRAGSRWDIASGDQRARFAENPAALMSVELSKDGAWVLGACTDGAARVWDAATGALVRTLSAGSESLDVASFSPDGRRIVAGGNDGTARVWDATSGELLATLEGHRGWVFDATFSPDGERIATASFDGTARIWEASSGQVLAKLEAPTWVTSARFSPDGSQLVTASSTAAITIWDVHAESRSAREVSAVVAQRQLPWRLVDGALRPAK